MPNEWKRLPRPEYSAVRRSATACQDGKCELSSTHSEARGTWPLSRPVSILRRMFSPRMASTLRVRCSCARPRSVEPTLGALIAALPPTVIGIAACSGAHSCALLGAPVPGPRSCGAADGAQAGHAVAHDRQARQERRGRRRGDLRSRAAVQLALRADQDRGPASPAGPYHQSR